MIPFKSIYSFRAREKRFVSLSWIFKAFGLRVSHFFSRNLLKVLSWRLFTFFWSSLAVLLRVSGNLMEVETIFKRNFDSTGMTLKCYKCSGKIDDSNCGEVEECKPNSVCLKLVSKTLIGGLVYNRECQFDLWLKQLFQILPWNLR